MGSGLFDEQALHLLALRAGLVRDQLHAEDLLRVLFGLIEVFRHLDAATLAAAAGVDLRLDHDAFSAVGEEAARDFECFIEGVRHLAAGHGNAVLRKDVLCLVFVNFHRYVRGNLS